MRARRAPLAAIILTAAAQFLHAAQADAPPQPPAPASSNSAEPVPTIHTTARLVVLDVVVTDANGNPAHGLKPSDFSLTEDGVPQTLASFTEHVAPANPTNATPLPPNTFTVQPPPPEDETKTVIVLADATLWAPGGDRPQFPSGTAVNTGYVRNDIATFLKSAPSTQPIAIVRLDWQGMHLVQGLTTDRQVLTDAVNSKRMQPPLGYRVRYTYAAGSPARQLVHYVRSIPGRINLVWITYGGDPSFWGVQDEFPDLSSVVHDLNGPSNVLRLSRVEVCPIPLNQSNIWANIALMAAASATGGHAYFAGISQALTEITAAGADYYTLSYVPTNPFWNGAFRKIAVKVAGYPQPPPPLTMASFWSQALGWTERQKSGVLYRPGYFANPLPVPATPNATSHTSERRIISYSPKGDPDGNGQATASALHQAMAFGTLPPDKINFTIVTTPWPEVKKVNQGKPLPLNNHLTEPFRALPYRNIRIHYWIDPQQLNFVRAPDGSYSDYLQFVAVVYRDDGLQANGLSSTTHVRVSEDRMEAMQNSGLAFDQTIAVPVAGNPVPGSFFLRVAVNEKSTGNIGAMEIPAEWVKLPPPQPTIADAQKQPQ